MNTGKTLFAQIMDFLPWSTFDRILPGEFGSANRTAVISSRYRKLAHVPCPCIRARALLVQEFLNLAHRQRLADEGKSRLAREALRKASSRGWAHPLFLRPSTFSFPFNSSTTLSNASKRASQS
jgi:hypothetical protein